MMTIDEIREALQDRRLTVIAAYTGLHYNTIGAIKRGEQTNPNYDTIQKLSAYLKFGHYIMHEQNNNNEALHG